MNISIRVAQIREKLNLSQIEFAKKLNIPSPIISNYESGQREPSRKVLTEMAEKFNININWLLTGKGNMFIENISQVQTSYQEMLPLLNILGTLSPGEKEKVYHYITELKQ